MSKSVFHIGFPKAGSTSLQRQVFADLPGYAYKGLNACADDRVAELYDGLFKKDTLNYNESRIFALAKDVTAEGSCLFSHESGLGTVYSYPDIVIKAQRLHKAFQGNLRIILIVRKQTDILLSQYRDHPFDPHDIFNGKPVSFEKWYRKMDKLRYFRFTDAIYYDRIVQVYDDLFGRENVLVLPMELMNADPASYAQKMGAFLDVDPNVIKPKLGLPAENTGHSSGTNRLRRLRRSIPVSIEFSKILPRPIYQGITEVIKKGAPESVNVSESLKHEIRQRYAASNKKLEERMDMQLEPMGYSTNDGDDEVDTVESEFGKYTGYKNDRVLQQTRKFGAHTRPELSMVLSFLREGDTALDIGAHIGTFSVPTKKAIGASGKLFSFEANPQTAEFLKKNLQDNNADAVVLNKGVSRKAGHLYIPDRANKYKSSGSDFLVEATLGDTATMIEVDLVKVDDAISDKVDFVKIDVEGMEVDVLYSAEKTIDQNRPIIYSEYVEYYIRRAGANPKEFAHFFKSRNYDFFINGSDRNAANDNYLLVKVPGPDFIRGQVDFLMIPRDSARYPKKFTQWYHHAPLKYLWNRFRNILKDLNAKWEIKK